MNNLVLFNYVQPLKGNSLRFGVETSRRDTVEEPLSPETLNSNYRRSDPVFDRSQNLMSVRTFQGPKAFYRERVKWRFTVPFVGALVKPFLPS
jgi:hypothetical protein